MHVNQPRILVTSALEESWPPDQPVLFLGEWCRLYARRARWSKMDAELVPYHWDDRKKLRCDYEYLQVLNETLVGELGAVLNQIHGETHSRDYWRIALGYWLTLFTAVVFDRWEMLQRAIATGSVKKSLCLMLPPEQLIAYDTAHFNKLILSDLWNHALYVRLMSGWTGIPSEFVPYHSAEPSHVEQPVALGFRQRIKHRLARGLARLPRAVRSSDCFFMSTGLSWWDDVKLQWRFGQLPKIWHAPASPRVKADLGQRNWELRSPKTTHGFEEIVRKLIPQVLPTLFLEGYRDLSDLLCRLPWPRHPALIWTVNGHFAEDVFKLWAAAKVDLGSCLVTGQHGGEATHPFSGAYSYQRKMGYRHFTWARDAVLHEREKPVGVLKQLPKRCHRSEDFALLVSLAMPRYSFDLRPMAAAGQMLSYFEDQFRFIGALPEHVQQSLRVRLMDRDYGWSQKERWQERFPEIRFDEGRETMQEMMSKARLIIATYNATTYLESFAMRVPTIIYWDPRYWELCDSAIPYFEELKTVGIFHENPASAARHVADIWHDVERWWKDPARQAVVERFRDRYCYLPKNLIERVEGALRESLLDSKSARIQLNQVVYND